MHVFQSTAQLPQQQFGQQPLDRRQRAKGPEIFLDQNPLLLRLGRHVRMPFVGPDRLARVAVSHAEEIHLCSQHYGVMAAVRVKDGANIRFVFEYSNVLSLFETIILLLLFKIRKFVAI